MAGAEREDAARRSRTPASRRSSRRSGRSSPRGLAVNGGLFLINLATGTRIRRGSSSRRPAWAFGLLSNYAKLWQAGYSWRDVLQPAAGARFDRVEPRLEQGQAARGCPAPPERRVRRAVRRRSARCTATARRSSSWWSGCRPRSAKCSPRTSARRWTASTSARPTWPDAARDGRRARHAGGTSRIDERIAALKAGAGRRGARPADLACWSGRRRRGGPAEPRGTRWRSHLESCVLAMQNVRLRPAQAQVVQRVRGAGRPHQGHPAGPGAVAERGQRHRRGERDQGGDGARRPPRHGSPAFPPSPAPMESTCGRITSSSSGA